MQLSKENRPLDLQQAFRPSIMIESDSASHPQAPSPPGFTLKMDAWGHLSLLAADGTRHEKVIPVHAFPMTAPDRWIWRAAFRIAAGELKERLKGSTTLVPDVGLDMPEPIADLVRALQTLSPNQRAAAVLALYADMPTRDVARILGCTQATVRVHLSQARRRLRALLEETDE